MILASGSPQRRAILEQLGVPFRIEVSGVDEIEQGEAEEVALENARRKARAVATGQRASGNAETVLGVDTVVALDERLYVKPEDREQAAATLRALAGRSHRVISGLCLIDPEGERAAAACTEVRFRPMDEPAIGWYLDTREWEGRAGGYAIQGRGAALVESIRGDYLNVVGLPVATLLDLLPTLLFPAI
jgi:septum formation protein